MKIWDSVFISGHSSGLNNFGAPFCLMLCLAKSCSPLHSLLFVQSINHLPKHGSSDGRAGASRSKGPKFKSRSGSYETALQRVICSILLSWLAITVSGLMYPHGSTGLSIKSLACRSITWISRYYKYQCPPKSYTAGLCQVLEAPTPLSWSNHREKSRRKAEEKNWIILVSNVCEHSGC